MHYWVGGINGEAGGQVAGGPIDTRMEITTVVVASVNANGAMR